MYDGYMDQDNFVELKSCSADDIMSLTWLEDFHTLMGFPGNEQFLQAYSNLGLKELSLSMQQVFWAVAKMFVRQYTQPFTEGECPVRFEDLSERLAILVKAGLVCLCPAEEDSEGSDGYVLSAWAAKELFYGRDDLVRYDLVTRYADMIRCASIEKKDLFYSEGSDREICALRNMISQAGFSRVRSILMRKKRSAAVLSLLWGPPGTGKTETVRQLALESGRDVVVLDSSKVFSSNWGASEKLHREFFRAYRYLASVCSNVPIMLLNEADSALSRRLTSIERAIDKSENIISNILLEELESIEGIVIATTNLIDNLDPAFDRRFLFKTLLSDPDEPARVKIWKSCLPELSDAEAVALASEYVMTGAQISNVVTKRDLAELYYDGDRGYGYIADLCRNELLSGSSSAIRCRRVGF